MAFWRQRNKVRKSVIIFNAIDMMNLPSWIGRTINLFPYQYVFSYTALLLCRARMIGPINPNITIPTFTSATLPMRVLCAFLPTLSMFMTKLRSTMDHFATCRTGVFIAFIISSVIFGLAFFYCNHRFSISEL